MCAAASGTLRLLDSIDYAKAAEHPKILVGYSDITALQLALFHRSGWRGLSGAMVAVEWPEPDTTWEATYWRLLRGEAPVSLQAADNSSPAVLHAGTVEGLLLGGNLSMVCRLLGTPYLPDLEGAILFLEGRGRAPVPDRRHAGPFAAGRGPR